MTPKSPKTSASGSVSKNIKQVVDKVNSSTNILVTVSRDPSVDELSAALGLTAILDKMGKHGTAIFSGATPPAIQFLNPDAVFEDSADSLRDFIVAINKDKADHLRYKVDGDIVKIFITPYRTPITEADLEFSQGDYNVELVFAIGAENQEDLDTALAAHGRILHDAAVIGVGCAENKSSLGSIEWYSENASSFSEMIADLADMLSTDEKALIDDQVATALLTGIVASTDRFSNLKTTSHVMTLAAQLMSKGADQQLIAARLQESHEISDKLEESSPKTVSDAPVELSKMPEDEITLDLTSSTLPPEEIAISRDTAPASTISEPQSTVEEAITPPAGSSQIASAYALEEVPEEPSASAPAVAPEPPVSSAPAAPAPETDTKRSYVAEQPVNAPATPEAPKDAVIRPQHKVIAPLSSLDRIIQPLGASANPQATDARAAIEAALAETSQPPQLPPQPVAVPQPPVDPQMQPVAPQPPIMNPAPVPSPVVPGMPMPPPLPDFSTLPPPLPPAVDMTPPAPAQTPERLGDIFAPESAPVQPQNVQQTPPQPQPPIAPQQPLAGDPSQFQIPGQ